MLEEIRSGGQRGADLAGLDAAKFLGIKTGGWAPKEWRICNPDGSDGSDPTLAEYGLKEHSSSAYPPRTRQNVKDSDGTAWFGSTNSAGARVTLDACGAYGKPVIVNPTPNGLREWIEKHQIKVLNVAGNRVSDRNPNIYQTTYETLIEAFAEYGVSE